MQSLAVFTPAAPIKAPVPALKINASDILSVPLFLALRRGVVNPCITQWSPDFPLPRVGVAAIIRFTLFETYLNIRKFKKVPGTFLLNFVKNKALAIGAGEKLQGLL